jgi:hypothetical protein
MTDQNLSNIAKLCFSFTRAVENDVSKQTYEVREQILACIKSNPTLDKLAEKIVDYSFRLPSGVEPSIESLKMKIEFAEVWTDICMRVFLPATIADIIPAELKNQADADTLRSLGAPKLASLCEFKK